MRKRVIRNVSFHLSSSSFATFLSQTSEVVHISLHLSTWSPWFTSCDLYLRCRSLIKTLLCSQFFVTFCQWNSVGEITHGRMNLLPAISVNTKQGGTQNKTHVPSRVLLLFTYSQLSSVLSFLSSLTICRSIIFFYFLES